MGSETEDIELIERYLEGKLDHQELRDFNRRLDEDREFARKVRIRQTFPTLLTEPADDSSLTQDTETNSQAPASGSRRFFKILLSVIGVLLVVGLIVIIFLFSSKRINNNASDTLNQLWKKSEPSLTGTDSVVKNPAVTKSSDPESRTIDTVRPTSLYRTNAIELVVPEHEQTFSRNEAILFQWEQATDSTTNFYIVSVSGKKIYYWKGIKPGIHEYLLPARTFIPGRYDWFVGTRANKRSFIITD